MGLFSTSSAPQAASTPTQVLLPLVVVLALVAFGHALPEDRQSDWVDARGASADPVYDWGRRSPPGLHVGPIGPRHDEGASKRASSTSMSSDTVVAPTACPGGISLETSGHHPRAGSHAVSLPDAAPRPASPDHHPRATWRPLVHTRGVPSPARASMSVTESTVFAVILSLGMGILWIVLALRTAREARRIERDWRRADGLVVGEVSEDDRDLLRVSFHVEPSPGQTAKVFTFETSEPGGGPVGSRLLVLYDPEDPKRATFYLPSARRKEVLLLCGMTCLSFGFAAVALAWLPTERASLRAADHLLKAVRDRDIHLQHQVSTAMMPSHFIAQVQRSTSTNWKGRFSMRCVDGECTSCLEGKLLPQDLTVVFFLDDHAGHWQVRRAGFRDPNCETRFRDDL